MTKENPDKLCASCKEFDFIMNRKDGVCSDILVICDHEEDKKEEIKKDENGHL
jgi:cupin superfamily acireductone dioxygenase involved in methionine salvage